MRLNLTKKQYQTLNTIEISQSALVQNFKYLSGISNLKVAPVLKSNAYGHGLQLVAKVLDNEDVPFFCVDSLFEAYELLKINIKTPIHIMGYTDPENVKVKKLPFSFTVFDKEMLMTLNKYQPGSKIHIFIDTGLHREGIQVDDLPEFLEYIKSLKNISIEGLMSHFAMSDQFADPLTVDQVNNFQKAQLLVQQAGIQPKWIHIANSAGLLLSKKYDGMLGNIARVGIATYGIGGELEDIHLKPALRALTKIGQIKHIKKGEKIGYDFTYTAKKDMVIGVLPYGYYDGMDRRLSNSGFVTVDGILCPIIGRVSMNITTIDVSKVRQPQVGQTVIVYSNNASDKNSIQHAGKLSGTIQRDLLVHLSESTKRILV
ncbi:MAG TPA: alanine racemase [Candidatus Saccharimonadales bacterium]|nr:alanine racemase [Candidatus Saccharimonadales bacterium]